MMKKKRVKVVEEVSEWMMTMIAMTTISVCLRSVLYRAELSSYLYVQNHDNDKADTERSTSKNRILAARRRFEKGLLLLSLDGP